MSSPGADAGAEWAIRRAVPDESSVIARHRALMFEEMGRLHRGSAAAFREKAAPWIRRAMEHGDYLAWVAYQRGTAEILGGAGVLRRPIMPAPAANGRSFLEEEGLVLNVYVDAAWRSRGVARALMQTILDWGEADGIGRLVLHASPAGRPLYQQLGFETSPEMRLWMGGRPKE